MNDLCIDRQPRVQHTVVLCKGSVGQRGPSQALSVPCPQSALATLTRGLPVQMASQNHLGITWASLEHHFGNLMLVSAAPPPCPHSYTHLLEIARRQRQLLLVQGKIKQLRFDKTLVSRAPLWFMGPAHDDAQMATISHLCASHEPSMCQPSAIYVPAYLPGHWKVIPKQIVVTLVRRGDQGDRNNFSGFCFWVSGLI